MTRLFLALPMLALLPACATSGPQATPPAAEDFVAAVQIEDELARPVEIVETVRPLPLPGQMMRLSEETASADAMDPADAIERGREGALIEPSADGYVNAIQVYPYTEGALYRLYSSPGQISDIALQPGETLVSVSAGDTVRWVVGDTLSGSGSHSRAHVLVKPISAGINTNLMIATDRRTYHLELVSTDGAYMAAMSWRYPADELSDLTARNGRAISREARIVESGVSVAALDFEYTISGDHPDWSPVRVFDDGRQVFIQMPADITASDLPPLFVLGQDGNAELVNYRVRDQYYIVDRLFQAAELRLGTRDQIVVRITKGSRRSPLAALFGG